MNSDVTKEMLTAKDFANPTLPFKAYAVQKDNVASASDAWAKVPHIHSYDFILPQY